MTAPKAVLFDIDGTLIDTNDLHVEAWYGVFLEAGHPIPRERIRGQIGKGGDNLVPDLLPQVDDKARRHIAERHGHVFAKDFLSRARAFPGAHDLLAKVHDEGIKVVLASSAKRSELDHYVELLDVEDLVEARTSIDDVETSKPAPDIFAVALEKAKVAAGEALVLGDSPYDMEAAAKSGVRGVGLLSGGFDEQALRQAGAVTIFRDVAHLLARYAESPLSGIGAG